MLVQFSFVSHLFSKLVMVLEYLLLCSCQLGNNFHFQRFIRTTDSGNGIAKAAQEKNLVSKRNIHHMTSDGIRILTHVQFLKKLDYAFILSQKLHKSMYCNTSKHTRQLFYCKATSKTKNTLSFLTFSECFSIPIIFSNMNYSCSNLLDIRNLQEQVKKAFC